MDGPQTDPWAAFNPQAPAPQNPADALGRPVITSVSKPEFVPGAPGYIVKGDHAEKLKGVPDAVTTADASLSPEALDAETTNWILTGKMSPLGMGGGPLRVQIQNNRPILMKRYGITENQLPAIQQQFKADSDAYNKRVAQGSFMTQAEEGARGHAEQITKYLQNLPAQTNIKALNAISLAAQREFSGEDVTNLDATIPLLKSEIAKIMTANPSGSGQLTDDARHEFDILEGNVAPERKIEALNALLQMAQTKVQSNDEEGKRLSDRMTGGLQFYARTGGAPGGTVGGDAPPAMGGPGGDPNPFTNGNGGPTGPTLTPSGGETRSVIDPRQQALGDKIAALMSKGADRNTIMGFAVGASPKLRSDPAFRAWMDQALAYRAKHPGAKFAVDPSFYTTDVPLSTQEKIGNAVAQSAPGAAAMEAANTVTAGHLGDIVGDNEGVNRALAIASAQHPYASLAGMVGGGASAGAGLEAGLARAGIGGAAQPIIADALYGGAAGATPDSNGNYLGNMAKGAIIGLLGGQVGKGIAKGTGAVVNGVTDPTVSYVARELPGKLTIGQALSQSGRAGAAVKGIEDRLAGLPVVGDAINARRTEGLQAMNSKAFDRALEPIKGTVAGQFGEDAVSNAQDQVSAAFQKALAGKSASIDRQFAVQATKAKMALDTLPDSVRPDVEKLIDSAVNDYFDKSGHLTGENMQPLLQELGTIKRSYQNAPGGHRIGKVVDQFTDSVESMFQRQALEVMPQYNAAKQAFKRVSTLEGAVLTAKNVSKDGNALFTSAQLGQADKANTVKFGGKHAAAAGKGDFHEFQRNMQEVLPSKVPDSGTAGRLLVPGALIAAGGAGGEAQGSAGTGLTLGALLAMAYSKTGQRALTAAALKSGTGRRSVGSALSRSSRALGHGTAGAAALGLSDD